MTQPSAEVPRRPYFEDILPRIGWGLYYKFMITMACVSSFAQAIAFFALPFAIALATCEHSITSEIILDLHGCFIFGRALGGLFLNSIGDIYGRKRLLTHSMLLIFMGSFMAAFAYNYYVIMVSAIVLASGLEAHYFVVRVHLSEVLPLNRRGCYLAMCDICWCIGYAVTSLFGVLLKGPITAETAAADMRLTYWRLILAIAGGLNITMACATALLEESPRFFLHIKKNYLAVLTLKQFFAINKSSYGEYFEIRESDLVDIIDGQSIIIYPEPHGCINVFKKMMKIILQAMNRLLSEKYIRTTVALLFIKLPLLILGHLEENIMLTKYSHSANSHAKDGTQVIHLDNFINGTMCHATEGNETYCIYFMLLIGIIIGIQTVACLIDCIGRKILTCTGLLLCGVCCVTLFFMNNVTGKIIASAVLMASFSAVVTTVTVINIESYPTALRCTSWGVSNSPGLIIGHFVIRYFDLLADSFLIVHGILFFGAAIASYFLLELKRKPMVE